MKQDYRWMYIVLIVAGVLYILEAATDSFGFVRMFPWYAVAAILLGIYGLTKR